jgi:hypothetical protein
METVRVYFGDIHGWNLLESSRWGSSFFNIPIALVPSIGETVVFPVPTSEKDPTKAMQYTVVGVKKRISHSEEMEITVMLEFQRRHDGSRIGE